MSQKVDISPASPADLDSIMTIEKACFGDDSFSRRQMYYLVAKAKGVFLTAKDKNDIAGYVSFLTTGRNNTGRLYSIAVADGYRGRGIAEQLLDKILEYACRKGLRAVFLEVNPSNIPAMSLYLKKGFVKHYVKPDYYHDGSEALSMVLKLTQ